MQISVALLIFILILTMAFFILIFVASGIKILKESERVAVFRLGKFLRISGPGIIWVTPILDKIAAKLSLREQQTIVDTSKFVSGDGSASRLTGFVNWRIIDTERAVLGVENYRNSTDTAINHQIRKTAESLPSDAIIYSEEQFYSELKEALGPALEKWGIRITEISLKTAPHWE
jgi:regulator of protease activity HflC (stomatin/prohibitin superfamily)